MKDGLPEIDWIPILAGPFVMGTPKGKAPYDDETPQFTCTLIRQPYRISRYAVTVAQYRAFTEAGGYEQAQYWTQAGWRWRRENKIIGPETYSAVLQTPNHPQVGVSWYEAMAFCSWFSAQV